MAITPLYVQRDDHALGLIRLLTIGLRGMGLFEFEVRRQLAQEGSQLSGIYAGTPKRATTRPTTERMLDNFGEITLNIIYIAGKEVYRDLTKLTPVQLEILRLLNCDSSLYTDLTGQFDPVNIKNKLLLFINNLIQLNT